MGAGFQPRLCLPDPVLAQRKEGFSWIGSLRSTGLLIGVLLGACPYLCLPLSREDSCSKPGESPGMRSA